MRFICFIALKISKVIRSKENDKENIMNFYYIIKKLYNTYLTSYDFMENASFWKTLYSCYYKYMLGTFSK